MSEQTWYDIALPTSVLPVDTNVWLEHNVGDKNWTIYWARIGWFICFRYEQDAIVFKLRFAL